MEKDLALIEQFLDALWLEKNLAENTLSAYRRDLTLLVEWLAHRGLTLESAQSDDLQGLLAERMEGGYKATSSARLLSAMRRTGGKRALACWNRCPILLLSGADDPVGAMGSGVRQLGAAMERAGLPVQTVLLPGARHDIFHEEAGGAAAQARSRILRFCETILAESEKPRK